MGALSTASTIEKPFDRWSVRTKPLGSTSQYGDIMGQMVPNALYFGGMMIAWYYFDNDLAFYRGKLMFEATAYAALVTQVLKTLIPEPRPANKQRNAFPSGHSATAFSFAGVVAAEHGWKWGVPAMALAAFVGYSRINDNAHRLHDVIAGREHRS